MRRVEKGTEHSLAKTRQRLWYGAKSRAAERGREFSLKVSDIEIPARCPVFGVPFFDERGTVINSPSIDRVDNSRGYVPGNIRVISRRANTLKGDANLEEMRAVVRYIESNTEPAYDWL